MSLVTKMLFFLTLTLSTTLCAMKSKPSAYTPPVEFSLCLVACGTEEIMGQVDIEWYVDRQLGRIENLFIEKQFRKRGIGSFLFELAVETLIHDFNAASIQWTDEPQEESTDAARRRLRNFYIRLGGQAIPEKVACVDSMQLSEKLIAQIHSEPRTRIRHETAFSVLKKESNGHTSLAQIFHSEGLPIN